MPEKHLFFNGITHWNKTDIQSETSSFPLVVSHMLNEESSVIIITIIIIMRSYIAPSQLSVMCVPQTIRRKEAMFQTSKTHTVLEINVLSSLSPFCCRQIWYVLVTDTLSVIFCAETSSVWFNSASTLGESPNALHPSSRRFFFVTFETVLQLILSMSRHCYFEIYDCCSMWKNWGPFIGQIKQSSTHM